MARWALYCMPLDHHPHINSSLSVIAMVVAFVGTVAMVSLVLSMCAQLHNRVQSKEVSDGEMSRDQLEGVLQRRWMHMGLSRMSNKRPAAALLTNEQAAKVMSEEAGGGGGDVGEWVAAVDAVWTRSIMMGERCEPPSFSGLILYDEHGNQVPELPSCRSPHHYFRHPPNSPSLRQLMSST